MKPLKQIFFFLFCCFFFAAMAVPAKPKMIFYNLPDGSSIRLYIRGDERVKWSETEDGYTILRNKDGFFEYAVLDKVGSLVLSGIQAKNAENRSWEDQNFLNRVSKKLQFSKAQVSVIKQIWGVKTEGQTLGKTEGQALQDEQTAPLFKALADKTTDTLHQSYPLILVEFADVPFSFSNAFFDLILNQPNYTSNGATGSVYDYFLDNSFGRLKFKTDILGPFKLSQNMAYYGKNDTYGDDINPRAMAREALDSAYKNGCDFSKYDVNNDGKIDGVHIIYSGEGEEASSVDERIWAHAWNLKDTVYYDNLSIFQYSCSAELSNSNEITNIGVIVHEMSHVFGLPDFYDTDFSGSSGMAVDLGDYDLMASGSWNNDGKTPPYHNVWSRSFLGWQTSQELNSAKEISLQPSYKEHFGYYYKTKTENEAFYFENRQKQKWDTYLPGNGLLIFHVDKNHFGWKNNCVNCNPNKRGFYLKQANGNGSSTLALGEGTPYPGSTKKTEFTDKTTPSSRSWRGTNTEKPITSIKEESGTISLDFMGGKGRDSVKYPFAFWMLTKKDSVSFSLSTKAADATDTIAVDFGDGKAIYFEVRGQTLIVGKNQQKDTLFVYANHLSNLVLDNNDLEALFIDSNRGLSHLSINSNLLDSLDLTNLANSLKVLSCSNNQIQFIRVPGSLENLNCSYNQLLFSSLSSLSDFDLSLNSNIIYAPQNKFLIGKKETSLIEQGLVSLGSEMEFNHQASDITWFDSLSEEELSIQADENGDFLFGPEHHGKRVYCLLTNSKLPQFTGTNSLRSVAATVSKVSIEKNNTLVLTLYPNPVPSTLFFSSKESVDKVEVFNLIGQRVLKEEGNDLKSLSVACLLSGNYILRFYTKSHVYTQKIVKVQALN